MSEYVLVTGGDGRAGMCKTIEYLPLDRAWRVTIEEYKVRRTDSQNSYLWGVCYRSIKQHLEGWDLEDIHEFFMGECFGWETIVGLGTVQRKPLQHSSRLNVEEFSQYVEFVQRKAAELGIVVPEPSRGIQSVP
jgi:hypothetical protein